jgi:hypothetical protein
LDLNADVPRIRTLPSVHLRLGISSGGRLKGHRPLSQGLGQGMTGTELMLFLGLPSSTRSL